MVKNLLSSAILVVIMFSVQSFSGFKFSLDSTFYAEVCYSPYREGQHPTSVGQPTKENITSDLVLLRKAYSDSTIFPLMGKLTIRTFGMDKPCLRMIPAVCESLSISYVISGWTSFIYSATWASARNDIVSFLKIADSLKYTGLRGVIYGYNNGFDNATPEAEKVVKMIAEINLTKKAIAVYKVNLGHEENWDFWIRNPSLADSLDFIGLRIMPQSDLIPLSQASAYVDSCYSKVKAVFPNKRVVVTSVGWSTFKDPESYQETFLRSVLTGASSKEMFLFNFADESWKSGVEGCFGIFAESRFPKLFAYRPKIIDFSNLFLADSLKLDGLYYGYGSLGWPNDMSQPALIENNKKLIDTIFNLSRFTVLTDEDVRGINGLLPGLIGGKNKISLVIRNYIHDTTLTKLLKENNFSMLIKDFPINSILYDYGKLDSVGREKAQDILRWEAGRFRMMRDSIFLCPLSVQTDSLVKYPELIRYFDGIYYTPDFYKLIKIPIAVRAAHIDSVLSEIIKKTGKKIIINIDAGFFSTTSSSLEDYKATYNCFLPACKKYGLMVFVDRLSTFYGNIITAPTPSKAYIFLMPWRFGISIISPVGNMINNFPTMKVVGQKLVVSSIGKPLALSIVDMRGRVLKKYNLKTTATINMENVNLSSGMYFFLLKIDKRQQVLRFIVK